MPKVADLYALQEIDSAIDACKRALDDIAERLGESQELLDARARVPEAQAALERLRHRQRELEWEVQNLTTRIEAEEEKLYGGSIRNPKELTSLQHEVEIIKAQRARLEDELLALMSQVDEAEAALTEARSELAAVEARWLAEQNDLLSQQSQRQQELARLQDQRAKQIPLIDTPTLRLYEAIRQRRQGRAVVRIERGMCGGCRIALPTTVLQRARSGFNVVQCTSCERILYMS